MADAFFTEQHELVRKLAREFAETELTKEVLDKVEEEEVFPEEILLFRCEFIPKGIGTFCQFQILLRKHGNHLGFIKLKLPLF